MENLLETISLDLEDANDLAFKVQIEGATSPATSRLVCEGKDISYMFKGRSTGDGIVEFTIPQMSNKIQEGTYLAKVEVLIENRYFAPVQFQINFKKTMKVFAEAIKVEKPASLSEMKVTAAPIVQKPKPQAQAPQSAPPARHVQESQRPVQQPKQQAPVKKKVVEKKESDDFDLIRESIRTLLQGTFGSRKK